MPDEWPAIADHGLIGDLRTWALVATFPHECRCQTPSITYLTL
jgi:hypothetical protein